METENKLSLNEVNYCANDIIRNKQMSFHYITYYINLILGNKDWYTLSRFVDMVCNGAISIDTLDDAVEVAMDMTGGLPWCSDNTKKTNLFISFISSVRAYSLCWKELCTWSYNVRNAANSSALRVSENIETHLFRRMMEYWKMVTFYMYQLEQINNGVVIL